MQLIAIYNVYDGLELLEGSFLQIFPACFKCIIHYQTTSNFGELDEDVEGFVRMIASKYNKIKLLKFEPDLTLSGGQNEKNKRMLGINYAKKLGASHFICIDCDEYYVRDEFEQAKQIILENNYDSTACRLFTYFKYPTYQLTPLENYYVPFIHSADLILTNEYPVYADPTRIAKGNNFYEFKEDELKMHHFSWVRNDIGKKLRNSSANINWAEKIPKMIENHKKFKLSDIMIYYPSFSLIEVENRFHIKLIN